MELMGSWLVNIHLGDYGRVRRDTSIHLFHDTPYWPESQEAKGDRSTGQGGGDDEDLEKPEARDWLGEWSGDCRHLKEPEQGVGMASAGTLLTF